MDSLRARLCRLIYLNVVSISISTLAETKPVTIKSHPVNPSRILARYVADKKEVDMATLFKAHGLIVREKISLVPGLIVLESEEANHVGFAALAEDASEDKAARL